MSMTLDLRIRELRKARGWSLETLAGKVSISSPHLSQIERGEKNLNNRLIDELADHLGVHPSELFAARQRYDNIVSVLNDLTPDDMGMVRDFAAALAKTQSGDK